MASGAQVKLGDRPAMPSVGLDWAKGPPAMGGGRESWALEGPRGGAVAWAVRAGRGGGCAWAGGVDQLDAADGLVSARQTGAF